MLQSFSDMPTVCESQSDHKDRVCFRLDSLLQIANKIQNMALECEEKLTLAKNTLQAVSSPTFVHLCPARCFCTSELAGMFPLVWSSVVWSPVSVTRPVPLGYGPTGGWAAGPL